MGRPRSKEHASLPPCFHQKNGKNGNTWYYFVADRKAGGWIPLGNDKKSALERYYTLIAENGINPKTKIRIPYKMDEILFKRAKAGAVKRGITFNLTVDDITALLEESKMRCSVTGIKFEYSMNQEYGMRAMSPSIDRIDSKKPYEPSNIRLVLSCVNIMINRFGDKLFWDVVRGAAKTHGGRLIAPFVENSGIVERLRPPEGGLSL